MDETELLAEAEAAADRLAASLADALPEVELPAVKAALAMAWVEGRQAGGDEAKQIVKEAVAKQLTEWPGVARVELSKDKAGEWRFKAVAANGEPVAVGEGYVRHADAKAEAEKLWPGVEIIDVGGES